MKIAYSREKITDSLMKGKKNIFSIAVVLLTLILVLIVYGNQSQKIGLLNSQKEAELKKNDALSEIARLQKKINSYSSLFSRRDAAAVTNLISSIAKSSNVRAVSIKPAAEENLPLYIRQSYVLVIEANGYHAIGKFISRIENQPDMYFVDAISIKLREEKGPGQEALEQAPKPEGGLIANVTLSIIVFKG